MRRSFAAITALACLVAPASVLAENAYITNLVSANVSVIDTATNTVIATIPVGIGPRGVAVTPSVIATATNTVIATIPLGGESNGVAVTPDGRKVYVANSGSNNVFVIDTATNAVIGSPIPVGLFPFGVAVTPDGDRHAGKDEKEAQHGEAERDRHRRAGEHEGGKVYVANRDNDNVSVIATATNTVIATIPVGSFPLGVAVTPDGRKVYVANSGSNNVFVIDTASNLVLAVVSVGIQPVAFGAFIRQPAPFAGTPREPGCHGKSVSALAEQFGGLPAAATARGFSSVPALQDAINVFCRGGAA